MPAACDLTLCPNDDLGEAIAGAADGAVICLRPGTYLGGHDLHRSVTLRAVDGPGSVRLDADDRASCVSIVADDMDVILEGLTLTGGSGVGGGGVAVHAFARVTLVDCVLTGNRSRQAPGGAAYLAQGTLTLKRCRLVGNTADDAPAVLADEIASLLVEDCLVIDEVGPRQSVVRVRDGAEAVFRRSTIVANGQGAALHVSGTTTRKPEVQVLDCVLDGPIAIDAPAPFGAAVRTARTVLSSASDETFEDLGGTIVGDPRLSPDGVPAPGSPAQGIAQGGDPDLRGKVRPTPAAAGALEP